MLIRLTKVVRFFYIVAPRIVLGATTKFILGNCSRIIENLEKGSLLLDVFFVDCDWIGAIMETKGNKEKCTLRFCDAESLSVAQEIIKHIHDDGSVEVRISGNDIVIIGSNSDISLTVNEINLKVTSAKMFIF